MSSIRELQRRIKSVKNISQVTKAMEMVSASKMRRAQDQVLASRPYAAKCWEILTHIAEKEGGSAQLHPLLMQRDNVQNIAIIMITADKGLAGGYNGNMIRAVTKFMKEKQHENAQLLTVGRKGRDFMLRYQRKVIAEFVDIPSRPKTQDILPMARIAIDGFLEQEFDEVYLAYTDFINTMSQKPTIRRILPIEATLGDSQVMREYLPEESPKIVAEYTYEPNPTALLDVILPSFIEVQIYQGLLEAIASEHSARMVAMRNATDNAKELIDDLTLQFNKARQDAITKEILDIVGGAEALAQN